MFLWFRFCVALILFHSMLEYQYYCNTKAQIQLTARRSADRHVALCIIFAPKTQKSWKTAALDILPNIGTEQKTSHRLGTKQCPRLEQCTAYNIIDAHQSSNASALSKASLRQSLSTIAAASVACRHRYRHLRKPHNLING